jgi:hypothetical protein
LLTEGRQQEVAAASLRGSFRGGFQRRTAQKSGTQLAPPVGNHAGRDGRTPTDDPRLLASQRSARDQQVSPGNYKGQSPSAGEARGCHPAWGCVVGKQIKPNPLARQVCFSRLFGREEPRTADTETLIGPKRTQIGFRGSS